ncbi:thymus-specific serine protease-like [Neocloeon triangulifer]|uniref:thymus-specific serine protease-like n=1 Tax=Neocloeon triangulifer TaxID=2078957 RepID=UPI00286F772A|nr:thymus-specific serine protease-like [Neocloeon triangulifer]
MIQKILLLLFVTSSAFGSLNGPFSPKSRLLPAAGTTDAEQLWHTQIVDHSRPLDTRTFSQRYFMTKDHYVQGGPIFLFLDGEWDATGNYISNTSFVGQMAARLNGALFELEHRYYGLSQPIGDLETESLLYLSIDQALADAADFALKMNEIHNFTGPWIVCGTSYSGMIAGFARQKYSHVFHAAYSSSGQQEAKVDFFEYHEMTGVGLAKVNPLCPGYLSAAMDEMVALISSQQPASLQYVSTAFNLCPESDLTLLTDARYLYALVANLYGAVVQFAFPGMISAECDKLMDGTGTPLLNLAEVVKQAYPNICLNVHYDDLMEFYRNSTAVAPGNNYRQYIYQTCTELGWFFTLSGNSPFGNVVPVEYFIDSCADVLGEQFSQAILEAGVARTNLEYGGKIPDVTRAIFTHGSFDGWTKVAAEADINADAPVIVIQDVGHAAEQFFFENDPPQLIAARERVELTIAQWISQFNQSF